MSNLIPVIEHPRDRAPIAWQIARGEPIAIDSVIDMIIAYNLKFHEVFLQKSVMSDWQAFMIL